MTCIRLVFIPVFAASLAAAQTPSKAAPGQSPTKAAPKKTGTTAGKTVAARPSLYRPDSLKDKAPEQFRARFTTTKGDIVIEVTRAMAPLGADRFYNLVKYGFYNGASLFRVVPGFVIQFGISPTPAVNTAWDNAKLKDDPVQSSNVRGSISFATSGPNTRTTQVFINLGENSRLDGMGFAPFGKVVEGMDVAEKLYSGYADQPTNLQDQIAKQGPAFLKSRFPELDSITKAVIEAPGGAPATAPAKQ